MKANSPVYWKMRNGDLISVDDMDINHLRNTLKMIIRKSRHISKQDKFIANFMKEAIQEIENDHYDDFD